MAGEPVGSGAGQSASRTQAVAPLLAGFPRATPPTANPLVGLASLSSEADAGREHPVVPRRSSLQRSPVDLRCATLYSEGEVDTPDRTVTARRVRAEQQPEELRASTTSRWLGTNFVNEFKVGYNAPQTSASAFSNQANYDPVGVSLSGTFTSSSIDARGTTGIARSGLLIRATSASTTTGSIFDPRSISLNNATTWTRGRHTLKGGFEYRQIQSDFQFLGSTEITYNSINDFIDNRPAAVAVALDSPVFRPQQFYAVGFVQDYVAASTDRLTLDLGLRYDYYSVVKEADGRARPFFVEDNAFAADGSPFYDADKNNFSPRLSAAYRDQRQDRASRRLRVLLRPRPVRRSHPADRELHRAPPRAAGRRRRTTACLSGAGVAARQPAVDSRLHAPLPERIQHAVRRQPVARAAG